MWFRFIFIHDLFVFIPCVIGGIRELPMIALGDKWSVCPAEGLSVIDIVVDRTYIYTRLFMFDQSMKSDSSSKQ